MSTPPRIVNGGTLPLASIPLLQHEEFSLLMKTALTGKERLAALFAVPGNNGTGEVTLYAVTASPDSGTLTVFGHEAATSFPSLTPELPQLHLFEREIAEQYGVAFPGHPWFKPVRFHATWNGAADPWQRPTGQHPLVGDMDFFQVEGDEIHEVGVGPVHAGIIEPGHFRFQCYGEKVLHLEISLGYQHRGMERLLLGGPWPQTPMQIETMAGDTTIGHMTAYSRIIESLSGCRVSARAQFLRAVALELERLANHVGDIGAMAGDVGYLPTSSFCGRLRGDYLNMTATLCGSRFGRGLVRPGGVLFDAGPEIRDKILTALDPVAKHTTGALDLFFDTSSVLARLEGTGTVNPRDAVGLGLVGVAGRACGIDCDVRRHFDPEIHGTDNVPAMTSSHGDVFARAMVRRNEVIHSTDCLRRRLNALPDGACRRETADLAPETMAICMVEGWRGTLTHAAITGIDGRFSRYKVIDPSFFNWNGLAMALRDGQISDFPLCNKSFNLSYCGFDL
ncbi:MAG: hydrogenase [Desulfobulbaceae bacterium DB1]|nr:MAG: hydrogenase [Desulfobulbaceae bacterium DB1]